MRIQFKKEGGIAYFPGLSQPVTIESDQLPKDKAADLKRLVEGGHLFDLPTLAAPPPSAGADYYQYTVTVEDGGRLTTVRLADPIGNPALQALVDFLEEQARALRADRARTPA